MIAISTKALRFLWLTILLLIGCSRTLPEPNTGGDPAQSGSNSEDPGFAVSFANNWLISPSLDEVEKVKSLLDSAKASHPEEVQKVLDQVLVKESSLKHELLLPLAERKRMANRILRLTLFWGDLFPFPNGD